MAPATHRTLIRDDGQKPPPVEWPVLPLGHLGGHLVGDPGDGVLADAGAVDIGEVRGHLTGGQTPSGQRQHQLVHAVQAPLSFLHDLRLKRAVAIPGHVDLDRPDLGQHGLGPGAVARVLAVAADRVVLVIAQVLGDLLLQRGLQHRLGQPGQQPAWANKVEAPLLGLVNQPLRDLLLLLLVELHGLDRLGHQTCFPAKQSLGVSGQDPLHR